MSEYLFYIVKCQSFLAIPGPLEESFAIDIIFNIVLYSFADEMTYLSRKNIN